MISSLGFEPTLKLQKLAAVALTLAVAICLAALLVPEVSIRGFLLFMIGAVLVLPLLRKAVMGQFDILDTLVWANAAFLAMFLFRPLALHLTNDFMFRGTYDISSTFDKALIVALVGSLGLQVGYHLRLGTRVGNAVPQLPARLIPSTTVFAALVMLLVGLFVRFGISEETLTSSSAYIYQAPYLIAPACMLLTAIGREYRSPVVSWLAYTIVAAFSVAIVPTGQRLLLMQVGLGFIVLVMLRRNWRPSMWILIPFSTLLFFLILGMRDLEQGFGIQDFVDSVRPYLNDPLGSIEFFFTTPDTEMFNGIALELQAVPQNMGFKPGSAIYLLFTHAIPRSIWSGKPVANEDLLNLQFFSTELGTNGVAYSILGGFWSDSGYIGVFLGMVAVGIGFRFMWEYYRKGSQNDIVCIVYAVSLPYVISILRGNLQYLFAIALFTVMPIVVVAWITGKKGSMSGESTTQRGGTSPLESGQST